MKMVVQYWRNRGEHSRLKFVAFRGGYHGDTTGAMAVSDPDAGMHEAFKGLLPEHVILDLPAASDAALSAFLQGNHGEEIAGIIVEPLVQGAGGMKFHDAEVLQRLRALADRYGVLLIFDGRYSPGWAAPERCSPAKAPAWCRTSSRCRRH